ncbi:DNA polymerase III subunit delta' [Rodentibacter trehalosifermentans]|uniref:DNA polymerase III subunit delta' n=1 Tax=Rodentibacter trehalosifermentans TaxID=1908263 RepID=A0A1V3IVM5_9PAST|nr:DNA polymerase III subunit delta' [Rodentibacter trehalosifermentans]OOF46324.1 DNA polymerase III subunit delta' [Rodentibacter trehalosifermentans]OOF53253.1 DNA polymerase III subunit delta' [Rodentibacter trehalosifermentans]
MTALYPWLTPLYAKIAQTFSQGLGHHALLIKSDSGLGVERLFEALSQRIMCLSPQQTSSCGHCHACHLMQANTHPDYHELSPIEDKDIGVDQVREINEIVAQHAQQNGNKAIYVKGAERLTEAAANALLKTLEEPRPNTYFLLQADSAASLLATIYSRCQVWNLPLPPKEMAQSWLQTQCEAEKQDISTALSMGLGRPLLALAVLQQGLIEQRKDFLRQFWRFYRRRSPLELLPLFDKEHYLRQLDWILAFLADSLKHKLAINGHRQVTDLMRGVEQFSDEQTALGLLQAIQIMQKVRLDLCSINGVNVELILLDGLTKLITEVFEK